MLAFYSVSKYSSTIREWLVIVWATELIKEQQQQQQQPPPPRNQSFTLTIFQNPRVFCVSCFLWRPEISSKSLRLRHWHTDSSAQKSQDSKKPPTPRNRQPIGEGWGPPSNKQSAVWFYLITKHSWRFAIWCTVTAKIQLVTLKKCGIEQGSLKVFASCIAALSHPHGCSLSTMLAAIPANGRNLIFTSAVFVLTRMNSSCQWRTRKPES